MDKAKFLIEFDQKLNKQLEAARKLIDLNTTSGKKLDNLITPLFRKYGFLDGSAGILDIIPADVPDKECPFQNMSADDALKSLGLDVGWVRDENVNMNLSSDDRKKISKIYQTYVAAAKAVKDLSKTFGPLRYTSSGNQAHNVFMVLHWVTDLEKAINAAKSEMQTESKDYTNIIDTIKSKIYKSPKKVSEHISSAAKLHNLDSQSLSRIFVEHVGETPSVYAQMVLDEGIGDYISHAAATAKNKFVGKYGIGQSKVAAQSKLNSLKGSEAILTKWTALTQGQQKAATPQALKTFLTTQLKMDPATVDAVLKKYKGTFKESIGEVSNSVIEAYLPKGQLRNFFLDAINTQRLQALKPVKPQKPATNPAPVKSPAPVSAPVATQAKPTKSAPIVPTQTAPATSTAAPAVTAQPTPVAPTADSVKQMLSQMSSNDRATALIKALDVLSDAEVKQVLSSLLTPKKP